MKLQAKFKKSHAQRGAALLIAIFALLLISVVAIALIVSSGTDSALATNYRSSSSAYYASLAGIEEARSRLLPFSANCIPVPSNANCTGQPPLVLPLTQVVYIINPLNGETVAPQDTSNPTTYPDTEYKQEFGVDVGARTVTTFNSVSAVAGLPGPLYKWVRINAVTEQALGDPQVPGSGVDVNADNIVDSVTPLFYDPANAPSPGLVTTFVPPATASQALEITSYAVLPNGSQTMVQSVIRPLVVFPGLSSRTFPAALTLDGNNVYFDGPGSSGFFIVGQDQCGASTVMLPAIGYTSGSPGDTSKSTILYGAAPASNYDGSSTTSSPPPPPPASTGSFVNVGGVINPNWLSPSGLDAIAQDITNAADVVITGPATPSSFPSGMSPTHYMTIVVNGDLDLNGWRNTGYGLLLVTGTLKYDPDASWQGLVLVIGQGNFVSTKNGNGGEIDGAVLIAKTRDAAGNLMNTLGASYFYQNGPGSNVGNGIRYNSCYAAAAMGPITYKLVSFREIPLAN